jgi:hypothetical protein
VCMAYNVHLIIVMFNDSFDYWWVNE